ncbi:hypothetical protein FM037_24755 [Shewanella psychropiezotolerans]|uniref:Uncharacterized protein n=1 Tax=Shewanella psychropiezotolerans TaxID=2593655 RepID=A0ABX5X3F8_9GAMM|nr:hypothetical protein [Shewanella psychropiezotolerans]QDO85883.1 hypothetical protein FM037_24755 [Shewanella psychropiezotolerans]
MYNESQRNLYGDMGMLGGVLSALPILLIALFTKLWWVGALGIILFILNFPFKEILLFSKNNLAFGLLTLFLVAQSIYSTYSFLEWRGYWGCLIY